MIRGNKILNLILINVFLIGLIACKKNKDEVPPNVSILSPTNNQSFQVYETIIVQAEISDNKNIEWVNIELLDDLLRPEGEAVIFYPNKKEYSIYRGLLLDNIHLESGKYYIKVTASDGSNEKSAFKEIYIFGVPRSTVGKVVVYEDNAITAIDTLDENLNAFPFLSVNQDFSDVVINSYYQQMIVGGSFDPTISCYDISLNELIWTKQESTGIPNPSINSVSINGENQYIVSLRGGVTKIYNKSGSVVNVLNAPSGYYQERVDKLTGDSYLSFCKATQGQNSLLTLNNEISGALIQQININADTVVSFVERNSDEIYVVYNYQGNGYLNIYYVSSNSLSNLRTFQGEIVYDALSLSNNDLLIAHTNGVERYTYQNNSLVPWLSVQNCTNLAVDEVNNRIYAVEGMNIYELNELGTVIKTNTLSNNINRVLIWYNK